jgi:hypothetical protein
MCGRTRDHLGKSVVPLFSRSLRPAAAFCGSAEGIRRATAGPERDLTRKVHPPRALSDVQGMT